MLTGSLQNIRTHDIQFSFIRLKSSLSLIPVFQNLHINKILISLFRLFYSYELFTILNLCQNNLYGCISLFELDLILIKNMVSGVDPIL